MPSVKRIAVEVIEREGADEALARLHRVAESSGVEIVDGDEAEIAIVLGGDGTMLRALARFLGTGVPVLGVNFGRVGFLTTIGAEELEAGLARVFRGEYMTQPLATLETHVNGSRKVAANDVVVASATPGRLIELAYTIGGEDLGRQPCDGLICATPTGSTAYNLSNGGPVLVWGLEAMAVTFIAPHALDIRPLVIPRETEVTITNLTGDVETVVLVDGQPIGKLEEGESAAVRVGEQHTLLATLPEVTFFTRYAATFGR
jgi:NAD+ kinase